MMTRHAGNPATRSQGQVFQGSWMYSPDVCPPRAENDAYARFRQFCSMATGQIKAALTMGISQPLDYDG